MTPTAPNTAVVESPLSVRISENTLLDRAYDEFCLREGAGEKLSVGEFLNRYSTIRSSLGRLLEIHNVAMAETRRKIEWPKVGSHYHGFQLERRLGDGASSRVYLAREPELGNRIVAIKITKQWESETYTLGRIDHPNVIGIYSRKPVPDQGLSVICMEYKGSATLCSLLNRVLASPKPPADANIILEAAADPYVDAAPAKTWNHPRKAQSYEAGIRAFFGDVCSALEYLHSRQILHRDLKPSNILMGPGGAPVLLDFNLALDVQAPGGRFGGTYPYMPPEQLRAMTGAGPASAVDERSDLFAVGVLLWETLIGKLPFGPMPTDVPSSQAVEILLERQKAGFQPTLPAGWSVSPELVEVVRRCLAFDPAERPATAAALRRLLMPETKRRRYAGWAIATAAALVAGVCVASAAGVPLPRMPFAAAIAPNREAMAERYQMGARFFQNGDDKAREVFKQITVDSPSDPRGWWALSLALVKDGSVQKERLADALHATQMANSYDKTLDYSFTGYLQQLRGVPDDARRQYRAALTKNQSTKAVRNNLAAVLLKDGTSNESTDEAIALTTQVLAEDPNCQPALINRGLALDKKAKTLSIPKLSVDEKEQLRQRSLVDLNRALEVGPASAELYYQIAAVMAFHQPVDDAYIDRLTKALDFGVDEGADGHRIAKTDGAWLFVRDRPEFQTLLARPRVATSGVKMTRLISPRTELPVWDR